MIKSLWASRKSHTGRIQVAKIEIGWVQDRYNADISENVREVCIVIAVIDSTFAVKRMRRNHRLFHANPCHHPIRRKVIVDDEDHSFLRFKLSHVDADAERCNKSLE
jgi:hypothetical protein